MSKRYPECPVYNHNNCKEIHNRKLCALVRKDKKCLKKLHKSAKKDKKQTVTERLTWTDYYDPISDRGGVLCLY
jgi:hypothetical protein